MASNTASDNGEYRIEHDTMGEVRVPKDAKWQAQTQRAVENFPISGIPIDPALVRALAAIKGGVAAENARRKVIPKAKGDAIQAAARRILDGEFLDEFPIDVFQTGSGTSSNMNMNEVLATLAGESLGEKVHPNDDVNNPLSSNDMFPSAIHIAACMSMQDELLPALRHLASSLRKKSKQFAKVVKSGRTHLMDAVPVTLGQEFGGYAAQIEQGIERIEAVIPRVGELPLGGSATGTGLNVPKGFAAKVIDKLSSDLNVPLSEARDHFAAQAARDSLVEASGDLKTIAVALTKIANDIRWMGSGPRTGLAEIFLPDLQPGSSIMPGKVNPVIPEAVTQVAAQVIGNDATVTFCGSQGAFELNVYLPVMARNLLESIRLLANVSRVFADKCIDGIEANVERCKAYAESSPSLGTSLNPYIGYDKAAEVIKESTKTGRSIRELVLERGWMTDAELDKALDTLAQTKGGIQK
ncbi:MAG TPA: class II fumarate hydratase [Acidimicrobiales bacterium]|jgi:fumarate hydratase, class II|nr:class II fumarate hydratase [Acidimicrobiales bacterium]